MPDPRDTPLRELFTPRNPAHADPNWYQRDLDDEIEDPDEPDFGPLPTARHRRVPGFDYGD